jgi:hypothetical protein
MRDGFTKMMLGALLLGVLPASGQDLREEAAPNLSVTTSPLYLLYSLWNVQAEYSVGGKTSVALELAGGKRSNEESWLTGFQYRYYFVPPARHGIYGAGNALWFHVRETDLRSDGLGGPPRQVWDNHYAIVAGPTLGYKYVHPSGFTVDLHLGAGVAWLKDEGQDWMLNAYPGILIGTNLGWSFRI